MLLNIWPRVVGDILGKKSGRIELLHLFVKDREALQGFAQGTKINWSSATLMHEAKADLVDDLYIIRKDSKILFSNFVAACLQDKFDLERTDFIKHVSDMEEGKYMRTYIRKKRTGNREQNKEENAKRTRAKKKSDADDKDDSEVVVDERPRKKGRRKSLQKKDIVVIAEVPVDQQDEDEKQQILEEKMELAGKELPNFNAFRNLLNQAMTNPTTPKNVADEVFNFCRTNGLLAKVQFNTGSSSSPRKGKEDKNKPEPKVDLEHEVFQGMQFPALGAIDHLFKNAMKGTEGENIVKAKLYLDASQQLEALFAQKNASEISPEDIDNFIKGCVSA